MLSPLNMKSFGLDSSDAALCCVTPNPYASKIRIDDLIILLIIKCIEKPLNDAKET